MSRVRLLASAVVLTASLAFPLSANAAIADLIWKLSGPRLIGFPVACEFELRDQRYECRAIDIFRLAGDPEFRTDRRLWLTITGAVYFSTGNTTEIGKFDAWDVQLLAYEPTLDVRSFKRGPVTFEHGVVGLSYFFLAGSVSGSDFNRFTNVGIKFTPVSFTYKRLTIAHTLRIFPDGFTSDQFDDLPEPSLDRPSEVVHGFSFGISF